MGTEEIIRACWYQLGTVNFILCYFEVALAGCRVERSSIAAQFPGEVFSDRLSTLNLPTGLSNMHQNISPFHFFPTDQGHCFCTAQILCQYQKFAFAFWCILWINLFSFPFRAQVILLRWVKIFIQTSFVFETLQKLSRSYLSRLRSKLRMKVNEKVILFNRCWLSNYHISFLCLSYLSSDKYKSMANKGRIPLPFCLFFIKFIKRHLTSLPPL